MSALMSQVSWLATALLMTGALWGAEVAKGAEGAEVAERTEVVGGAADDAATTAVAHEGPAQPTFSWQAGEPAAEATAVQPAPVGAVIPEDLTLTNNEGQQVTLRQQLAGKPGLLVIYRGGWCPFCTKQLSSLGPLQASLAESGVQIIGISPDGPEALAASGAEHELPYTLLGDPQQTAIARFGLRFRLDDETAAKYREYQLPLVADEEGHFHLPVPAVYVVDAAGVIRWAHYDPNFRERPDPELLSAAVVEVLAP